MQAENWKKVKEVLNEVLSLETSERQEFLDKSGVSAEIRSEVESLLGFEEDSEGLMHLSAVEFSKDFFDSDENLLIGQQIGVYRIVRELGYGGMGAVYLAERTDGKFSQRVALKLLKREMNTSALRRSFQQEQEILASLEHPNIARLLDAGTTDDKIPFLAMEYVEGLPIDVFCNKNNLDLSARLDLFRKVCAAVNFAHRNLIVHRDLKPSNILVNEEGTPKLLDFGISKILSAEFEQINSATVTKLGVMTPSYASPEQLQSKSVTTATDIYSLGVILYELLSGHRPFETKEANLKEIYNAVLETEPPAPSAVIWDLGFGISDSESQTVQMPNRTEKQKIETTPQSQIPNPKSLSGDLDNIVLKALRKEPERRYSSAENLAEDIHRHQRGLPVTARPNTLSYRAEKYFKRNKAGVIGGVLILLAIIGGVIATLWQARVAAAERDRAKSEQMKAENLNRFMSRILQAAAPEQKGKEAKILEVLNDAEQNIEIEFANQPEQKAQGYQSLGFTYFSIQEYEKANSLLQKSLQIGDSSLPSNHQITSGTLIYLSMNLNAQNKFDESEKYVNRGIEMERRISPNGSRMLAFGLLSLGEIYLRKAKMTEAGEPIAESVKILESLTGENDPDYAYALGQLGRIQIFQQNPQAEENLRKSISIFRRLPKNFETRMVYPLMNLGYALVMTSRVEEGLKYLLEADEIANRLNLPQFKFWTKNNLCNGYGMKVELGKMLEVCSEAVKLFNPNEAQEGIENVFTYHHLGIALTRTGKPQEGEVYLRKCLALIQKVSPNDELLNAIIKSALAEPLLAQNKTDEARPLVEDTYSIIKGALGKEHHVTISALNRLVNLYEKTNNTELVNKYRTELPQ